MALSKNWKAYYLKDFGTHALIVYGEVKTFGSLQQIPSIALYTFPSLDNRCLNIELINAGKGDYTEVKEVFFPDAGKIEIIQVYNEDGLIEASIPVTAGPEKEPEDILYGEFYDD